MTDHYATLGVAKNATQDEIKRAFRKLASQHHPDKGGDTAVFQKIQAAYDVLGDQQKRQQYDNPMPNFGAGGPGGFNFSFGQGPNLNDIFGQMFGQQGFSGFHQHPRRSHVRATLWISLTEAARGVRRTVNLGTANGTTTLEIEIPRGVDDGENVQYEGLGPNNTDLVVQYRLHPDPTWQRQGLTVQTERRISVWDLITGTELEITNLQGVTVTVAVPQRCTAGTVLRVRGHGLENRAGHRGDLLIKLVAEIPSVIHPELVAAIEKYR